MPVVGTRPRVGRYYLRPMSRFRALTLVMWLVACIAGLPGITPSAAAQEAEVSVAVRNIEPFVMTAGDQKTGFTIDILQEIAKRAGWTVSYVDTPSVAEQLKAVTEGRADAAAAAISITSERAQKFDFSQPIMSGGSQIMVPLSASQPSNPGLLTFVKLLFSKTVLVWLVAAVVLALIPAHITWLLERRHSDPMVSKSYFPGILQSFRWSIGSLAGVADDAPRHAAARIASVLWGFICIIFIAYYTATLTANITVGKFEAQIKSPADLIGKKVCTVANTTSASTLKEFGVTFDSANTVADCYRGLEDGKFQAVVYDAPVLQYYASREGRGSVQLVGQVIRAEEYGIAFRNGSELRKKADKELLSIYEDGTYYTIKKKWFGSDSVSDGAAG